MKRFLLSIFFITIIYGETLFANNSFTLTDHISNDTLSNLDTVYQWGQANQFDIVVEVDIINNTSNSITYQWVKVKTNGPWEAAICDKNNAYIPSVAQQQFTLAAGEKGILNGYFYPEGVDGVGTLKLKVVNISDNSDSATIVYSASTQPAVAAFGFSVNDLIVDFSDSSSNATGWLWNFGDGDKSSLQNPSHTYTVADTYTVELVVTNPISSDTISKSVIVGTTGLFEIIELNNIQIYPNPSSGELIIDGNSFNNDINLSIINQLGQKVYHLNKTDINLLKIDLNHLKNGIYFIRIKSDKGEIKTFKINLRR